MQLELNFSVACVGLYKYLSSQTDKLLSAVFSHESKRGGNCLQATAKRVCSEMGTNFLKEEPKGNPTETAKIAKQVLKHNILEKIH